MDSVFDFDDQCEMSSSIENGKWHVSYYSYYNFHTVYYTIFTVIIRVTFCHNVKNTSWYVTSRSAVSIITVVATMIVYVIKCPYFILKIRREKLTLSFW